MAEEAEEAGVEGGPGSTDYDTTKIQMMLLLPPVMRAGDAKRNNEPRPTTEPTRPRRAR